MFSGQICHFGGYAVTSDSSNRLSDLKYEPINMWLMLPSEGKISAAGLGGAGQFSGMDVFQDLGIFKAAINERAKVRF